MLLYAAAGEDCCSLAGQPSIFVEAGQEPSALLSVVTVDLTLLMIALSEGQNVTLLSVPYVSVEIATLTRENGKTVIRVLKQKEVEQLIKQHEEEEAKAEREKKEKEQKEKDK